MISRDVVAAACAAALLAAACGNDASASLGSVYEFHGQNCGAVSTDHDWAVPASASECLLSAWSSGEPAHLRATGPPVEGDPIDRKSTRPNSRHYCALRMPSSA